MPRPDATAANLAELAALDAFEAGEVIDCPRWPEWDGSVVLRFETRITGLTGYTVQRPDGEQGFLFPDEVVPHA